MRTREQKGYKRIFLFLMLVTGLATILGPTVIQSQEAKYPSKPLEIIVPFAPGGIMDISSRLVAEFLPRELKTQVVVRNQAGGGGLTGSAAFLDTKPDGYSMLAGNSASLVSTVQLSKTPPFDPRKDFLPVGYLGAPPLVMMVNKASPFKSFDDFVKFARSNPGKLKGGFNMIGTEVHFLFLAILRDAKIEVKAVPFTGVGPLMTAILGGHVDFITGTVPGQIEYMRSGDVRPLLLTRASPELPGVPTGSEKGCPTVSLISIWAAYFVHAQTPKPVYDTLVSAIEATTKNPELRKKFTGIGFDIDYKNPRGLSSLVEEQWTTMAQLIKEAGLKVN
jgi:tripartite-type tricarboxylate transporter receptor subunit TctC